MESFLSLRHLRWSLRMVMMVVEASSENGGGVDWRKGLVMGLALWPVRERAKGHVSLVMSVHGDGGVVAVALGG